MNGEGVFKRETLPVNHVPVLVLLSGSIPSAERPFHRCRLNTPSPFMERGPGGEVFPYPQTTEPTDGVRGFVGLAATYLVSSAGAAGAGPAFAP